MQPQILIFLVLIILILIICFIIINAFHIYKLPHNIGGAHIGGAHIGGAHIGGAPDDIVAVSLSPEKWFFAKETDINDIIYWYKRLPSSSSSSTSPLSSVQDMFDKLLPNTDINTPVSIIIYNATKIPTIDVNDILTKITDIRDTILKPPPKILLDKEFITLIYLDILNFYYSSNTGANSLIALYNNLFNVYQISSITDKFDIIKTMCKNVLITTLKDDTPIKIYSIYDFKDKQILGYKTFSDILQLILTHKIQLDIISSIPSPSSSSIFSFSSRSHSLPANAENTIITNITNNIEYIDIKELNTLPDSIQSVDEHGNSIRLLSMIDFFEYLIKPRISVVEYDAFMMNTFHNFYTNFLHIKGADESKKDFYSYLKTDVFAIAKNQQIIQQNAPSFLSSILRNRLYYYTLNTDNIDKIYEILFTNNGNLTDSNIISILKEKYTNDGRSIIAVAVINTDSESGKSIIIDNIIEYLTYFINPKKYLIQKRLDLSKIDASSTFNIPPPSNITKLQNIIDILDGSHLSTIPPIVQLDKKYYAMSIYSYHVIDWGIYYANIQILYNDINTFQMYNLVKTPFIHNNNFFIDLLTEPIITDVQTYLLNAPNMQLVKYINSTIYDNSFIKEITMGNYIKITNRLNIALVSYTPYSDVYVETIPTPAPIPPAPIPPVPIPLALTPAQQLLIDAINIAVADALRHKTEVERLSTHARDENTNAQRDLVLARAAGISFADISQLQAQTRANADNSADDVVNIAALNAIIAQAKATVASICATIYTDPAMMADAAIVAHIAAQITTINTYETDANTSLVLAQTAENNARIAADNVDALTNNVRVLELIAELDQFVNNANVEIFIAQGEMNGAINSRNNAQTNYNDAIIPVVTIADLELLLIASETNAADAEQFALNTRNRLINGVQINVNGAIALGVQLAHPLIISALQRAHIDAQILIANGHTNTAQVYVHGADIAANEARAFANRIKDILDAARIAAAGAILLADGDITTTYNNELDTLDDSFYRYRQNINKRQILQNWLKENNNIVNIIYDRKKINKKMKGIYFYPFSRHIYKTKILILNDINNIPNGQYIYNQNILEF